MNKQTRTYEEIITLQDKAIEALTQANAALVMALEALKKARAEHGFTIPFPGIGLGQNQLGSIKTPTFAPTYVPNFSPNSTDGVQWGGQSGFVTVNGTGLVTKTETANSLIQQANSQKELATAYINAFQGYQDQNASSEVVSGVCVH